MTRKHFVFGHIANSNQANYSKPSCYTNYDLLKHNRQKLHLAVVKTQFLPRKKTTGAQFGEQHLTLGLISHFTQRRDLSPKINPTQSTRGEMVVGGCNKDNQDCGKDAFQPKERWYKRQFLPKQIKVTAAEIVSHSIAF